MSLRRPGTARESGSVSTQLVVATPLLLLMIMLIVQFALWQHAMHVAEAAAQEGATAARLYGGTDADGQNSADEILSTFSHSIIVDPAVSVTRTATAVQVAIASHVETIVPGMSLPVNVVADGPIERFTPTTVAP